jgi:hypothetical protein
MNRQEHLDWCKQRALEYVTLGNLPAAWTSFTSDMGKHEETRNHSALELGSIMLFGGQLNTQAKMCEFINGFN